MKTKNYSAARVRSASYNEELNSIEVVWAAGADVERYDDYGNVFVERLLMDASNVRLNRLNSGASFLELASKRGAFKCHRRGRVRKRSP